MKTCPLCGKPLTGTQCACGYDESRDYECYPTLSTAGVAGLRPVRNNLEGILRRFAALLEALPEEQHTCTSQNILREINAALGQPTRRGSYCLMADSIPEEWYSSNRMTDYPVSIDYLGNQSVLRKSVRSVTFLDSLAQKGKNAWDVSEAQYGTVWAWTVPAEGGLVDLYIGANGQIQAPANSGYLFCGYNHAKKMSLNCLRTEGVTNMNAMFEGCHCLTALDVSRFDTAKVTNMGWMFSGCKKLVSLDLSAFVAQQLKYAGSIFAGCDSLCRVKLPASKQDADRLREKLPSRLRK